MLANGDPYPAVHTEMIGDDVRLVGKRLDGELNELEAWLATLECGGHIGGSGGSMLECAAPRENGCMDASVVGKWLAELMTLLMRGLVCRLLVGRGDWKWAAPACGLPNGWTIGEREKLEGVGTGKAGARDDTIGLARLCSRPVVAWCTHADGSA